MGSLPDSKYIVQTDGYYFVESHDVDPSKGYISVSAKGIINGLSNIPNDGADFGPDTYNPDYSGSGVPYTYTSGIQEAVNYTFANNSTFSSIKLCVGTFSIDATYASSQFNISSYCIKIPQVLPTEPIVTLRIDGESSPLYTYQTGYPYTSPSGDNASIIVVPNGVTTVNGGAVIGTDSLSEQPVFNTLQNNVNLLLSNLVVRVGNAGTSEQPTAISGDHFAGFKAVNVVADIILDNTIVSGEGVLVPQPIAGIGISLNNLTPANNGLAVLDNVYVYGYDIGIYHSAGHLSIIGAFIQFCEYGLNIAADITSHPTVVHYLDIEQCTYPVYGNSHTFSINGYLNFQSAGSGWEVATQYFTGCQNMHGNILYYITGGTSPLVDSNSFGSNLTIRQLTGAGSVSLFPAFKPTTTLSTNPPVSGTTYQNTNPYGILIYLPVYTSTSGTAGNIKASIGPTSTPATQVVNDIVNSGTSSTNPRTVVLKVPAGWYYEFTGTTTTFGTATVVAD